MKKEAYEKIILLFLLLLIVSCGINKGKKQPTKSDVNSKSTERQQCIEDSIENTVTKPVYKYSILDHNPDINGITIGKSSIDDLTQLAAIEKGNSVFQQVAFFLIPICVLQIFSL